MTSKTIEGVGFAAVGPEGDYLLTIAPNGAEDHVYASLWVASEINRQGFWPATAGNQKPRAYRFRIVVEAVPLSEEETEELLVAAR